MDREGGVISADFCATSLIHCDTMMATAGPEEEYVSDFSATNPARCSGVLRDEVALDWAFLFCGQDSLAVFTEESRA